jgi:hypothetical protein
MDSRTPVDEVPAPLSGLNHEALRRESSCSLVPSPNLQSPVFRTHGTELLRRGGPASSLSRSPAIWWSCVLACVSPRALETVIGGVFGINREWVGATPFLLGGAGGLLARKLTLKAPKAKKKGKGNGKAGKGKKKKGKKK